MMIKQTFTSGKILLILIVLFFSNAAFSQKQQGQGDRPKGPPPIPSTKQISKMVDKMAEDVSLTETQEAEILTLYTNHFEEIESKTKSGRPDRDEMRSIKNTFENEINAVLTEEQQGLYKEFMKKNRPEQSKRRN